MSKLSFSKCIYDRSFFFSVLRSQQFKLEEIEEIYLIFYFSYQNESSSVPDDKLSFLRSFQSKVSLLNSTDRANFDLKNLLPSRKNHF